MKKLSKKVAEWCELSGYDVSKIKKHMKTQYFAIEKLSKKAAIDEGCDLNYPYKIYNPFGVPIKK